MSATTQSTHYFQWQKTLGLPVFLRVPVELLEGRLLKLLTDLGFGELSAAEQKVAALNRAGSRVISLSRASARVARQVSLGDTPDRYGSETLSFSLGAQVYIHRRIGMLVFSLGRPVWELGVASSLETTEELMGLRVMLNRSLSWALAPFGVLGLWGITTDQGIVVMRQQQSFGEVVFIDAQKGQLFTSTGVSRIEGQFKIYRADKPGTQGQRMSGEELVSFLSTANTYLSHDALPAALKRTALLLGARVAGEWSGPLHASPELPKAS